MKRIYLVLCLFIILLTNKSVAQETFPVNGTTDPKHITYAFINATIFTDYKTSISSATLIIRDGIVVDAGASISIPSDAVVYDVKGKMIYPSLIDIFLITDYPK